MNNSSPSPRAATPWHLGLVGVLAVLWNCGDGDGAGWTEAEFAAMGVEHKARGARLRGHGTAQEIAQDMVAYRDTAGIRAFQINFNGTPNLKCLVESMDLFANEVRPALG